MNKENRIPSITKEGLTYNNVRLIIISVMNFGVDSTKWMFEGMRDISKEENKFFPSYVEFINRYESKLSKWEK